MLFERVKRQHGGIDAQARLGWLYRDGIGTTKSPLDAYYWLRRAADDGHVGAQIDLAKLYREPLASAADPVKAFHLTENAAKSGASHAILELARCHNNGIGTAENATKAASLYFQAANMDEMWGAQFIAMFELGRLCFEGRGIRQNYLVSYRLWTTAEKDLILEPWEGHEKHIELKTEFPQLIQSMTDDELKQVERFGLTDAFEELRRELTLD